MGFISEFKKFALKGNVMDMAVGVIIGGAFGKIVSSLVNDIIMPPVGALLGSTDFTKLRIDISKIREVTSKATNVVSEKIAEGADAVTPDNIHVVDALNKVVGTSTVTEPIWWNYGAFIQQCVDFTILALCVFMMVKLMNKLMKKEEPTPAPVADPAPTKEEILLAEIRDLLKAKK